MIRLGELDHSKLFDDMWVEFCEERVVFLREFTREFTKYNACYITFAMWIRMYRGITAGYNDGETYIEFSSNEELLAFKLKWL